ncbi:MAG TPA: hypothetical protein VKS79_12485 [Gemmataceae bacterium]|nr:hypothetical protein [Gemmataceae bacterium]
MISHLMILAVLAGPAQLPEATKPVSYYPLKVGNTWHYKLGDKKASTKVTALEKIGDLMTARIETIIDGNVVANENIAETADGIVRVAVNGQKADKPVLLLKLPPNKGDSWDINTKIAGETVKGKFTVSEEEVQVPAGKFKAVTSSGDFQLNGEPARFGYWFAPDVGIVKVSMVAMDVDLTWELQKFDAAK